MNSVWLSYVTLSLLLLSGLGCSQKLEIELGEVTGVITLDEKPAQNFYVEYWPASGARPSQARTNSNGEYIMSYNPENKGVVLGMSTVKIGSGGTLDPNDPEQRTDIPLKELLVQENVEVKKGNNKYDFKVTSKK